MRKAGIQILGLLAVTAAALCFGLVVVLSLKSSPSFSQMSWLPKGVSRWADHYENFRHFPGYAVLTILVQAATPGGLRKGLWVAGGLSLVAVALEVAQIWIPGRSSDWRDWMWSFGGILVGSLAWVIYFRYRNNWIFRASPPTLP